MFRLMMKSEWERDMSALVSSPTRRWFSIHSIAFLNTLSPINNLFNIEAAFFFLSRNGFYLNALCHPFSSLARNRRWWWGREMRWTLHFYERFIICMQIAELNSSIVERGWRSSINRILSPSRNSWMFQFTTTVVWSESVITSTLLLSSKAQQIMLIHFFFSLNYVNRCQSIHEELTVKYRRHDE